MSLLLALHIPGLPKTKGSVTALGRGQVRQAVEGSGRWASMVRRAVETERARTGVETRGPGCPIAVHLVYWLPVDDVTTPNCGDVDKLERNILDALTKAQVYRDDVQVVRVCHEKWPHRPDRGVHAGVQIRVYDGYV